MSSAAVVIGTLRVKVIFFYEKLCGGFALSFCYGRNDFLLFTLCNLFNNKFSLTSGARFTKHLKPKTFVSPIQFVWDLRKS